MLLLTQEHTKAKKFPSNILDYILIATLAIPLILCILLLPFAIALDYTNVRQFGPVKIMTEPDAKQICLRAGYPKVEFIKNEFYCISSEKAISIREISLPNK